MRRRGFTLTEMLVVMAVVGILLMVLTPVFWRAREKGREQQCANNLRQLYIAMINWAGDHDNHLPFSAPVEYQWVDEKWYHHVGWVDWYDYQDGRKKRLPDNPHRYNYWIGERGKQCIRKGAIFDYVDREYGVYLCPTFAIKEIGGQDNPVRSYSMNKNVTWLNMYGAKDLSKLLLVGDEHLTTPEGTTEMNPRADTECVENQVSRHHSANKGNRVYVDGHLERK